MAYFKRHFIRGTARPLAPGWASDAVDWHYEEVWVTLGAVTVRVYPNLEPAACKLALMHRTRTRHWSRSFLKKWRRSVRRELRHRLHFWTYWSVSYGGIRPRQRKGI